MAPGTDLDIKGTLQRCALLKPLSEQQLAALANCCRVVTLEKGETLPGDHEAVAHTLFAVASGRLAIRLATPKGHALETVEVGVYTLNGWLSLVEPYLYVAEATALQDSTLLVIPTEEMEMVLLSEPRSAYLVMRSIASLISARLSSSRETLAEVLGAGGAWESS